MHDDPDRLVPLTITAAMAGRTIMTTRGAAANFSAMLGASAEVKPERETRSTDAACPCCGASVRSPSAELLISALDLPPVQASILEAVWKGKGYAVPTERIFDFMYADDPGAMPTPEKAYSAFKVALHHLRRALRKVGIDIINVGYRRGYQLQFQTD